MSLYVSIGETNAEPMEHIGHNVLTGPYMASQQYDRYGLSTSTVIGLINPAVRKGVWRWQLFSFESHLHLTYILLQ